MHALLGIPAFLAIAWLCSEDRRAIPWRTVGGGLALHGALALILLNLAPARAVILLLDRAMDSLQRATDAGAQFLFGYLAGGTMPFAPAHPEASFILAVKILPLVLVISALSALLQYWGILQRVTSAFAAVLSRTLGLGGALSVGAATHIFLGMVEAPLLIRPYLAGLARGELFALMSCGMAGVAGTVMVLYASLLSRVIASPLADILVASVISTPAALAIAALMVPFRPGPRDAIVAEQARPAGALEALVQGTADGIGPLTGIFSLLLVAVALVTFINLLLAHIGGATLQQIAAVPFRPLMWLTGMDWREAGTASLLMGTKTVLNELVAYVSLSRLPADALSPHARRIVTYCLCGFANFGSLGIMMGGMGAMVPQRRGEIAALGLRSILAGTLATCLSGTTIGLLTSF